MLIRSVSIFLNGFQNSSWSLKEPTYLIDRWPLARKVTRSVVGAELSDQLNARVTRRSTQLSQVFSFGYDNAMIDNIERMTGG